MIEAVAGAGIHLVVTFKLSTVCVSSAKRIGAFPPRSWGGGGGGGRGFAGTSIMIS